MVDIIMKLQRYKPEDKRGMPPLVEHDEGEYVKYEDVEELLEVINDNRMELYKLLTSGWELRKTVSPDGDVTYWPENVNGKDNWRREY